MTEAKAQSAKHSSPQEHILGEVARAAKRDARKKSRLQLSPILRWRNKQARQSMEEALSKRRHRERWESQMGIALQQLENSGYQINRPIQNGVATDAVFTQRNKENNMTEAVLGPDHGQHPSSRHGNSTATVASTVDQTSAETKLALYRDAFEENRRIRAMREKNTSNRKREVEEKAAAAVRRQSYPSKKEQFKARRAKKNRRRRTQPDEQVTQEQLDLETARLEKYQVLMDKEPHKALCDKLDSIPPPRKFIRKSNGGLFGDGSAAKVQVTASVGVSVSIRDLSELPDAEPAKKSKSVRWFNSAITGNVFEEKKTYERDLPMPPNTAAAHGLGPSALSMDYNKPAPSHPIPAVNRKGEKSDGRHLPAHLRHPREEEVEETVLSVFGEDTKSSPLKADGFRDQSPAKNPAGAVETEDDIADALKAVADFRFARPKSPEPQAELDELDELEPSNLFSEAEIKVAEEEKAERDRKKAAEEEAALAAAAAAAAKAAAEAKAEAEAKKRQEEQAAIVLLSDDEDEQPAVINIFSSEEEETESTEEVEEGSEYEYEESDEDEEGRLSGTASPLLPEDALEGKQLSSSIISKLSATRSKAVQEAVTKTFEKDKRHLKLVDNISGVTISGHDMSTLLSDHYHGSGAGISGWLNDEIVNGYYKLLTDRANAGAGFDVNDKSNKGPPPYFAFTSAMYSKMKADGVSSVSRWTRRPKLNEGKLLSSTMLFFPVNTGNHWTLLTIRPQLREIEYLDSLDGSSAMPLRIAREWLQMELKDKFDPSEWKDVSGRSAQQNNGKDCGVFACLNGTALIRGFDAPGQSFSANEIPFGRLQMAAILLNGGFGGDLDWVDE